MIINHNMNAMNAHRNMSANTVSAGKSMEKLSSGLRINKAGDDAAGLAISEKMRGQIRGLDQASRNSQDGISMIQTAEGALNETHSILQRMRELAVQSSNDSNSDAVDRESIQKEIDQLTEEIDRIGNTTEFNTKKLLNGGVSDQSKVRTLNTATLNYGTTNITGLNVDSTSTLDADTYKLSVVTNTKALNGTTDPHTTGLSAVNVAADSALGEGVYQIDVVATIASGGTAYNVTNAGAMSGLDTSASELADGTYKIKINNVGAGTEAFEVFKVAADGTETSQGAGTFDSTNAANSITFQGVNFSIDGTQASVGDTTVFTQKTTYTAELKDSTGAAIGGSNGAVAVAANDTKVDLGKGITVDFGATLAAGEASFAVKATGETTVMLKDSSNNIITQQVVDSNEKRVDLGTTGISFKTGSLVAGDVTNIVVGVTTQNNALKFQIGANEGQDMSLGINDMRATALGVDGVDVTTQSNAKAAITTISNAITKVSEERSKLGAVQNRLEHTIANLGTASENLTSAESRIRDVDMAKEMMTFSKNNILSQAAQAMLAQANQQPQGVLQLLR